ncbi:hypothetical protein [Methylobacterium persicinum]|uniref:Uncharacterized protein n=1 Tax=Methylobacterium persicinum TaxID=374426 RepID=A0ABU0HHV2_9HYPH|nr:hypothetical protein [Methylobacterium persicinum]MDQ0441086.1 hypothetical protein [Methylobacterium persicinum]GJE40093.1 hypothetical protein KHHGKMAE_4183 [Methylobacterium persicinum]
MSPQADRVLTRLWLALAAPPVLAATLHLGAIVGAGRWPDLALAAAPVVRREAVAGALSPAAMEPAGSSPVMGCQPRSSHAKSCRPLPKN